MAISVNNMYSQMADMYSGSSSGITSALQSASSTSETAQAAALQDSIKNASSSEELMSACKNFEAYFLEQVFKSMQNTVDSSDEGEYTSMFGDMKLQAYAEDAVQGQGYGIAQMLYESMSRNMGSIATDTGSQESATTATNSTTAGNTATNAVTTAADAALTTV